MHMYFSVESAHQSGKKTLVCDYYHVVGTMMVLLEFCAIVYGLCNFGECVFHVYHFGPALGRHNMVADWFLDMEECLWEKGSMIMSHWVCTFVVVVGLLEVAAAHKWYCQYPILVWCSLCYPTACKSFDLTMPYIFVMEDELTVADYTRELVLLVLQWSLYANGLLKLFFVWRCSQFRG